MPFRVGCERVSVVTSCLIVVVVVVAFVIFDENTTYVTGNGNSMRWWCDPFHRTYLWTCSRVFSMPSISRSFSHLSVCCPFSNSLYILLSIWFTFLLSLFCCVPSLAHSDMCDKFFDTLYSSLSIHIFHFHTLIFHNTLSAADHVALRIRFPHKTCLLQWTFGDSVVVLCIEVLCRVL